MEKLNIAELLKDCPKGMELDCAIYENVELGYIEQNPESTYPIHCLMKTNGGYNALVFTHYGCNDRHPNAKCVIFPKGKTTWEGFVPPCKFKDGDVVYVQAINEYIAIYKDLSNEYLYEYASVSGNLFQCNSAPLTHRDYIRKMRLATEEEKQKLFDAIKANGYKWNPETKTLEKLIEPKFKVGDKIVKRNSVSNSWIVSSVNSEYYGLKLPLGGESIGVLSVSEQDNYELLLNTKKFDISTLKPFESRVLVRSTDDDIWRPAIYGFAYSDRYYIVGGVYWKQCVPYIENNQHLLGTTNDCDEYFKTWE